jgi:hypothetical protein
MELSILKTVGQIAGIGGVSLGVFLLLFKEVIRKKIFPMLDKEQAYRLIRLFLVLTFLIALAGLGAWVYARGASSTSANPRSDPVIDAKLTDFQKELDAFLYDLGAAAGSSAAEYQNNTKFYRDASLALNSVRIRAQALSISESKYTYLDQQLRIMEEMIERFRKHHEEAGKQGLSPAFLTIFRDQMNDAMSQILTLELY